MVSKDGAGVAAGSPTVSFVAGTSGGGWLGEVEAALFGVRAGAASGAASVADEVGANGSTATCVGDRTGTAVAGSSMTCSCPHPTNNRMLNDSTNRRHIWIPSFVNIVLIIPDNVLFSMGSILSDHRLYNPIRIYSIQLRIE